MSGMGAIALLAACSAAPVSESNAAVAAVADNQDDAAITNGRASQEQAPAGTAVATVSTDDPLKLVQALYAGHPWSIFPPGGPEIWHDDLAIGSAVSPEHDRTMPLLRDADFMVAGTKGPITNLRIEKGDATETEQQIIVTFDSGAQKDLTLHYGTVLTDDGWRISNVWRDDGWYLSEHLGVGAK
ncbi:MAG: hypothetical protein AB7E60_07010 [Sphingobium sp.]